MPPAFPSLSPTSAPTVSPTAFPYTYVGQGSCKDSSGRSYEDFGVAGTSSDIADASDWCESAAAGTSKLVGVDIDEANIRWYCLYDDDVVNNVITGGDFNPSATWASYYNYPQQGGRGAVLSANGWSGWSCYRNDVS